MLWQDPNLRLTKAQRVFIFLVGVLESGLFGGAVFGWPQLVHVLKVEGIYSHLCELHNTTVPFPDSGNTSVFLTSTSPSTSVATASANVSEVSLPKARCITGEEHLFDSFPHSDKAREAKVSCPGQDEQFAFIFTITVMVYGIPSVLVGFLLHHAGLWVTRITGGLMLCVGFIALGLTTQTAPGYLMAAMVLMALGGNQLRMSGMQFGDLFPRHRATAITLLSGMYASSAGLFIIFEYTSAVGVSRADVCWFLACVASLCIFSTFAMPVRYIPVQMEGKLYQEADTFSSKQAHDPVALLEPLEEVPLSASLKTLSSALNQYWFTICIFAVNIYQQGYNQWISSTSCDVGEATLFSNLFSYSNFVTVFFAPLGGMIADYMIRRARRVQDTSRRRYLEVSSSFLPLLITNILLLAMYSCLFFFHPAAIVLSLMFMIVARPFIIAVFTAYVRIRFPADHFNRLMGIYGTVMSALLFLQYPHFVWAQHMYYTAHGLVVTLLLLSFFNPLHLLCPALVKDALPSAGTASVSGSLVKDAEAAEAPGGGEGGYQVINRA